MPKLRTLTENAINALSCGTLHKLGCYFSQNSTNFNIRECPVLENCALTSRNIPSNKDVRDLYDEYKHEFYTHLDDLSASSPDDVDIILVCHYLHLAFCSEEYAAALEEVAIEMPRRGESNIEYTAKVFLMYGASPLSRASMNQASSSRQSFLYFIRDLSALRYRETARYEAGEDFENAMTALLSPQLKEKYRTDICVVRSQVKENLWIIEINHGGTRQKEKNESGAKAVDVVRQPLESDCIIYDLRYDDVRIHMEKHSKTTMEMYRKALGRCLFDNDAWWKAGTKYGIHRFNIPAQELKKMLARGAEKLANHMSGKLTLDISKFSYTETRRLSGGAYSTSTYNVINPTGYNNSMTDDETLVPQHATITSVTLRFSYGVSKKKSLPITISNRKRTLESEVIPTLKNGCMKRAFVNARC